MRSINSKLYSIIDSSRQAIRCHLEISAQITPCHPNITQLHERSLFCRERKNYKATLGKVNDLMSLQHNLTKSILGSSENILLRARLRFFLRRCASSPNQRQKMHQIIQKSEKVVTLALKSPIPFNLKCLP